MGATATWDYSAWSARYPQFSNVTQQQAQACWNDATIYHRNDGTGPVQDATTQASLLGMITAHLAFGTYGIAGSPSAASQGLTGRISSAGQGSVNVSTELAGVPGTAAWFVQTPWGLNYWQATAAYRTMHYRPGYGRAFPW